MRTTDKHIFFWRDPIAQWNMSAMKDPITGIIYNCSEQYMMHQKALLFDDEVRAKEIMKAAHPREQQALGRTVKGYDQKIWDANKYNIVLNACMLKFTQHTKHLVTLLDSGDRLFVEASPNDKIWGIGMREDDPGVDDPANWKGENLLGQAITETRTYIRELLLSKDNLIWL